MYQHLHLPLAHCSLSLSLSLVGFSIFIKCIFIWLCERNRLREREKASESTRTAGEHKSAGPESMRNPQHKTEQKTTPSTPVHCILSASTGKRQPNTRAFSLSPSRKCIFARSPCVLRATVSCTTRAKSVQFGSHHITSSSSSSPQQSSSAHRRQTLRTSSSSSIVSLCARVLVQIRCPASVIPTPTTQRTQHTHTLFNTYTLHVH